MRPDVNSGYCIRPDVARETRLDCLNRVADRGARVVPVHFGEPYCGYIRCEGDRFLFEPASMVMQIVGPLAAAPDTFRPAASELRRAMHAVASSLRSLACKAGSKGGQKMAVAFDITDFRLVVNVAESRSLTRGVERSLRKDGCGRTDRQPPPAWLRA